jgi:branched-chain amino acid transport system permease protein
MSAAANTLPSLAQPGFLKRNLAWFIGIAIVVIIPMISSSGVTIAVMNQMMIMILFTVSYNMLLGQGGMLSFGHAVYFGLGGYFSIHLLNWISEAELYIPLPFVPIIGGVAGLIFAIIIGSFSTNKAGTVFAMISLGIGEMIAASSLIFVKFSGGEEGITADRMEPPAFLGYEFGAEIEVYFLIAAWMLISVWLMYKFSRTPVGRIANAVRDNPERAEFVGYSQRRIRFISFCAAGFFAGIGGALFAINYEIVTEETVNAITSGTVLLQAYIGGVGFFAGPIVGAIVFTLLQTLLSNYTAIWALYVGIVFVATVMFAPAGLTGLIMMHVPIWQKGHIGLIVKPYLMMIVPALICAAGAIGLLELLHFVSERATGESHFDFWGFSWPVDTLWPWLFFGGLLIGGFLLCRKLAPGLYDAFQTASARAYGLEK